jgi:hypothetical protein
VVCFICAPALNSFVKLLVRIDIIQFCIYIYICHVNVNLLGIEIKQNERTVDDKEKEYKEYYIRLSISEVALMECAQEMPLTKKLKV